MRHASRDQAALQRVPLTRSEITVNSGAKALGLTLPPSLLAPGKRRPNSRQAQSCPPGNGRALLGRGQRGVGVMIAEKARPDRSTRSQGAAPVVWQASAVEGINETGSAAPACSKARESAR